jgi:hypothetical protein
MPVSLDFGKVAHVHDFSIVDNDGGRMLIDSADRVLPIDAEAIATAAAKSNSRYRRLLADEVYDRPRLQNAKDLLRYGGAVLALGDRLRLLSALEVQGNLTVAECLTVFTETKPIARLAQSLPSHRLV